MPTEQPTHAPLEVLRAASKAADDAFIRALDRNQTVAIVADVVWRRGISEGLRQATEALRPALLVPGYVSRGRRFVDVEPYPDAAARRVLGALDDAGLVGPWEPAPLRSRCPFCCSADDGRRIEVRDGAYVRHLTGAGGECSGSGKSLAELPPWEPAEQPEPARDGSDHGQA